MSALIRSASFTRIFPVKLDSRVTDVQNHWKSPNTFSELSFVTQNRTQILHQERIRIFDVTKHINCSRIPQVSTKFDSGHIEEIYKACLRRICGISEISSTVDGEKFKTHLELPSVKTEDIRMMIKGLKLTSPILRNEKPDDASQYIQEKYPNSMSLSFMNNVLTIEELCNHEGDKVTKNCTSMNNYSSTFDDTSEVAITLCNGKPEITHPGDPEAIPIGDPKVMPPDEDPEFIPPDEDPEFIPPDEDPEFIPPGEYPPDEDPVVCTTTRRPGGYRKPEITHPGDPETIPIGDPKVMPPDEDPEFIPPDEDPEFIPPGYDPPGEDPEFIPPGEYPPDKDPVVCTTSRRPGGYIR